MNKPRRAVLWLLFAAYCAALLGLLFLRPPWPGGGSWNFVPLRTIRLMLAAGKGAWAAGWESALFRMAAENLLGNVLLTLPLGAFLPALFPGLRRFWKTLALSAGLVACAEALQYLLAVGACDVDDLLLNAAGAAAGYGLWRIAARRRAKKTGAT